MKSNLKAKRIGDPFRKGRQYARKQQVRMLLGLMLLFAFVCFLGYVMDGSILGLAGGNVTMMSMMAIGNVGDVSDRKTHGSNIAYDVYLVELSQIDRSVAFPQPNASREVGTIPMLAGQYMRYFTAHDVPTYTATGEKGDITTSGENNFVIIMGGMRDQLMNFIEEQAGGKFIVLFREVGESQWYILGNYDRPMILGSYEAKNDKDGRYVTFTFTRTSIDQYYKYSGSIVAAGPATHTADATTLAVSSGQDCYEIPDGGSATYAISAVSGLTASDKGRHITLIGTGTTKAATIADSTVFVLEDGATWTAKSGSRITFQVLDATTLVEVSGSRVQTA